jgi:hypothetical protein
MKLELQVCLIDQAEKLNLLGLNQKAANYFWDLADGELYRSVDASAADIGCVAAWTVAEMGLLLPLEYYVRTRDFDYDDWVCYDSDDDNLLGSYKTEAEAKAAILIHLLETQLITPEECNNRLNPQA